MLADCPSVCAVCVLCVDCGSLFVVGCWLWFGVRRVLFVVRWLLVDVRCSSLFVGCWLLVVVYRHVGCCLMFVVVGRCLLLAVACLLMVVCNCLSVDVLRVSH